MGPQSCTYQVLPQAMHRWHTNMDKTQHNNSSATTNNRIMFLVVPYSKGLSKRFSKTCRSLDIQVHFKGSNTINNLFSGNQRWELHTQKSGVIYRYKCTQADCEEEYIRESGRAFVDRLKEHLRAPSPIYQHEPGHGTPYQCGLFHHHS